MALIQKPSIVVVFFKEKKSLWIVLALKVFMQYNHKRDLKGQCPTIQLWEEGHGTQRERERKRKVGGGGREIHRDRDKHRQGVAALIGYTWHAQNCMENIEGALKRDNLKQKFKPNFYSHLAFF